MSETLVPLTIIKGAGHEYISLPQGENATVADFHSIRTQTQDTPSYLTSGFYKIEAGPAKPAHYAFEETKYILNGQIDILVSAVLDDSVRERVPDLRPRTLLLGSSITWSRATLPSSTSARRSSSRPSLLVWPFTLLQGRSGLLIST